MPTFKMTDIFGRKKTSTEMRKPNKWSKCIDETDAMRAGKLLNEFIIWVNTQVHYEKENFDSFRFLSRLETR